MSGPDSPQRTQVPCSGSQRSEEDGRIIRTVQQHYDASRFDCMSELVLEEVRHQTLLGAVERYFDIAAWERVLDVGCGASARNSFFVRRYWQRESVALDLSWRTLQQARDRIDALFVQGSVRALPFRDGSFSFVISTGVIHHAPRPRASLHELARTVQPGGGLFVSVYNRASVYRLVYHTLGAAARTLFRWKLAPLVRWLLVPVYAAAYNLIVWAALRRVVRVPYRQASADFDDKFLTPYASFHTIDEVRGWIADEGLTCLASGTHMATMMIGFLISKE
ncbi:MAG: class I SAM-dependent methyltransferase [Anaerolineales bacterium]|nr:class I SAM-dependent methyltransferase [Anaerolineales bacterium]